MKVDGNDFRDASNDRVAAGETPAIPCTIPNCDDPFGIRDCMIGALQCVAHVLCHGTGHEQHIGMARRGDEAKAEALDVVVGVAKRVDFKLAAICRIQRRPRV